MLVLRGHALLARGCPTPLHARSLPRHTQRRFFWSELYDGLTPAANEFLDLAIALPYPPTWSAYASTIILTTVLLRLTFLPSVIWSRRKVVKMEQVQKDVEKMLPVIQRQEMQAMAKEGVRGEKQHLIEKHAERVNATMTKKFNELIKERKCDPKWTIPISALLQAPPYIAFSMILSRVAADPLTPFRSESFLTLTSLAHPDPTMALPIVLGIISMANVDTRSWWMTAAEQEREKKYHQWKAEKAEKKGKPYVQSPLKSILRGLSIARIGLAMLVPGGVQLYWPPEKTSGNQGSFDKESRRPVGETSHQADKKEIILLSF
ncbi:hypothetical protein Agabi119p4_4389 [Agaricus bisporus var. burnettii]|uniref:Uncharacterized protein n=1 Tax=Agaricus bisporus var. burnettii TaxID=192524 RepID=A0A8H7KH87_AGABI|nr:hypothetical protein Agabi119p4_4389 [Agaricus bisporus var. burnettii]